jgi:LmbE family N-acetylglucosaminyl deacetylase
MRKWIFISPHFDDVVLSVGGMVWELTQRGDVVEVWTMCAGDPPFDKPLTEYAQLLHTFWELEDDVPYKRSLEDAACNRVLGVSAFRRNTVPDNIYRYFPGTEEAVVKIPEDNQGPFEPDESYLVPQAADFLRKNIPPGWEVVIPLAVGHHRDHVLTRKAADKLGIPLWHFIDFPYVVTNEFNQDNFNPKDAETFKLEVSQAGLEAWMDGFACQKSQIVFLFTDEEEMRKAITKYHAAGHGATLWKF